ncbi:MAG: hypothetical protein ACRDZ1_04395 [Acidimicrobiia bacterium]
MARVTEIDEEFAREVTGRLRAETGHESLAFTGSQAQARREYGLTTPGGEGGRHRATPYSDLDVEVVATVEAAKLDREYRGKLHRAVLIAYARRAPIPDDGLRSAYRDHFKAERRRAERSARGVRQEPDEELAGLSSEDRRVFQRVTTAMLLGDVPDRNDLARFLIALLPQARDGLMAVADGMRAELGDGGLDERLRWPPEKLNDDGLGLVDVSGRSGAPMLLPAADRMAEHFNLALFERTARDADRTELDDARDLVRGLRGAGILDIDDFNLAASVPGLVLIGRATDGVHWNVQPPTTSTS